jgi:MFS family permease
MTAIPLTADARPYVRRALPEPWAYGLAASVIGLALFASGTPSPLYGVYRSIWGFSPLVLTLVYATYAIGVLVTLVVAGRLSDQVGRRPVLLVSLSALMLTSVLFMIADSVVWLFVARGLQGLATGLALSAGAAALLDLHPRRDPAGVSLANGVVSAAGLGLGVLVSAAIVELLPAPRVLPYVVLLILFAIAFAGALAMSEPVAEPTRPRLRVQRPEVPAGVRHPFLVAALGVLASWGLGGLFLSLGPALSASLLGTADHLLTAMTVVVIGAAGAIAQLVFGRVRPWLATSAGAAVLAVGTLAIVLAAATGSWLPLVLGAAVGGAGFGVAFLGALRALSAVIPPQQRAAVMSAFYVVAYLSLSVPAIVAGLLVTPLGVERTFEILGSVLAAVAVVVAAESWRSRPRPDRVPRSSVPSVAGTAG